MYKVVKVFSWAGEKGTREEHSKNLFTRDLLNSELSLAQLA